MNAAVTKKEVELALADRFGHIFDRHERRPAEILPTGVAEFDDLLLGLPRGAITEIHGQSSSGRMSLMISALATATAQEEICAVVDCNDTFDLYSAAEAEVDFTRVLWVRCGNHLERAFKAVDLILNAGGFGFIALNVCDVPTKAVRRIISSWWFRFRRTIENTPTALVVLTPIAAVRSCAALALELKKDRAVWPSTLSLVSENSSFIPHTASGAARLSLVQTLPAETYNAAETYSHFLQSTRICVNRERPVGSGPVKINFYPHRVLVQLAIFADIR
jgi:recombination protein RecA